MKRGARAIAFVMTQNSIERAIILKKRRAGSGDGEDENGSRRSARFRCVAPKRRRIELVHEALDRERGVPEELVHFLINGLADGVVTDGNNAGS